MLNLKLPVGFFEFVAPAKGPGKILSVNENRELNRFCSSELHRNASNFSIRTIEGLNVRGIVEISRAHFQEEKRSATWIDISKRKSSSYRGLGCRTNENEVKKTHQFAVLDQQMNSSNSK